MTVFFVFLPHGNAFPLVPLIMGGPECTEYPLGTMFLCFLMLAGVK